jgi:hypothetical protein
VSASHPRRVGVASSWLESLQRCLRKGLICESQFG